MNDSTSTSIDTDTETHPVSANISDLRASLASSLPAVATRITVYPSLTLDDAPTDDPRFLAVLDRGGWEVGQSDLGAYGFPTDLLGAHAWWVTASLMEAVLEVGVAANPLAEYMSTSRTELLDMIGASVNVTKGWLPRTIDDGCARGGKDLVLAILEGSGWPITEAEVEEYGIDPRLVGRHAWWTAPSVIDRWAEALGEPVDEPLAPIDEPTIPFTDAILADVVASRDEALAALGVAAVESAAATAARDAAVRDRDEAIKAMTGCSAAHEADIAAIGEALTEEADSRGWCDAYDDFVENLNRTLSVVLPERVKTWEVTLRVEYELSYTVSATSEDAAYEAAREEFSHNDLEHQEPYDIVDYSASEA